MVLRALLGSAIAFGCCIMRSTYKIPNTNGDKISGGNTVFGRGNEVTTELSAREPEGMAFRAARSVLPQLESLFEGSSVAGLTDRQLLERFVARRDPTGETAFAALVTRHGPMVLDVCRSIMGDLHQSEDVFQAVFLVLARRAR